MMMFGRISSIAVSRARNISTSATVVNVISKHIEDLSKKIDLILETRISLGIAKILRNPLQQELLQSQPRLANQLDFLKNLYKEIMPAVTTYPHSALSIVSKQLHDLYRKLAVISKVEDQLNCEDTSVELGHVYNIISCKSWVVHQFIVLKEVFEQIAYEIQLHSPGGLFENELENLLMPMPKELPEIYSADYSFQNMQGPLDKHRYLLVSNGCEIYCLDLKQTTHQSVTHEVPFLPIIATLDLLDKSLPSTVGLFKWRSKAIMIGGQKLIPQVLEEESGNPQPQPQGIKLYRGLCNLNKVKPTSRLIHRLSLDDSKTCLSLSESNELELRNPKIWPIVEEINGEIHVIDCLPSALVSNRCLEWTGSHEVFSRDNGCWVEEVPIPDDTKFHIISYVVVADKIYAQRSTKGFLLFDGRRNKWHVSSRTLEREDDKPCPLFKDVWDILDKIRVVSGVGGFPYGDVKDPLYVVIALEDSHATFSGTHAVAFLVNSSGQILCIQSLKHFFKGCSPCYMFQGKLIKVEEDKLGKKKTMCSIVTGSELGWDDERNTVMNKVLINTFSVEELPDAAEKVREVSGKGREAWPVEMEFARVDVMDRYVYKTDEELDGGGHAREWVNVQACFL